MLYNLSSDSFLMKGGVKFFKVQLPMYNPIALSGRERENDKSKAMVESPITAKSCTKDQIEAPDNSDIK